MTSGGDGWGCDWGRGAKCALLLEKISESHCYTPCNNKAGKDPSRSSEFQHDQPAEANCRSSDFHGQPEENDGYPDCYGCQDNRQRDVRNPQPAKSDLAPNPIVDAKSDYRE